MCQHNSTLFFLPQKWGMYEYDFSTSAALQKKCGEDFRHLLAQPAEEPSSDQHHAIQTNCSVPNMQALCNPHSHDSRWAWHSLGCGPSTIKKEIAMHVRKWSSSKSKGRSWWRSEWQGQWHTSPCTLSSASSQPAEQTDQDIRLQALDTDAAH